jgi:hypothetical protein
VLAYVKDRDQSLTVQALYLTPKDVCTEEALASVFEELALPASDRDELTALHKKSRAETSGPLEVWKAHLRQAIARCKAAGAVPVLVTYPFPHPHIDPAMEQLAKEEGAAFFALCLEVTPVLHARGGAAIYSHDGHPNDEGYAVMAGFVADDVLRRLPPR